MAAVKVESWESLHFDIKSSQAEDVQQGQEHLIVFFYIFLL